MPTLADAHIRLRDIPHPRNTTTSSTGRPRKGPITTKYRQEKCRNFEQFNFCKNVRCTFYHDYDKIKLQRLEKIRKEEEARQKKLAEEKAEREAEVEKIRLEILAQAVDEDVESEHEGSVESEESEESYQSTSDRMDAIRAEFFDTPDLGIIRPVQKRTPPVVTREIPTAITTPESEPSSVAEVTITEPKPTVAEDTTTEPMPIVAEDTITEPMPIVAEDTIIEPKPTAAEEIITEPKPIVAENTTTESKPSDATATTIDRINNLVKTMPPKFPKDAVTQHFIWFQMYKFPEGPTYIVFPETKTQWMRSQNYDNAKRAVCDYMDASKEYADTLTYLPSEHCFYANLRPPRQSSRANSQSSTGKVAKASSSVTQSPKLSTAKSCDTAQPKSVTPADTISAAAPAMPKRSSRTSQKPCRQFNTDRGCSYKHCKFAHVEATSAVSPQDKVEKLIDIDDEPTPTAEELTVVKTVPRRNNNRKTNRKTNQQAKPVIAAEPEDEWIRPDDIDWANIKWENNPEINNPWWADNYLERTFGTFEPSPEQAKEWIDKMGSQGNFRFFNASQLFRWSQFLKIDKEHYWLWMVDSWRPEYLPPHTGPSLQRLKNQIAAEEAKKVRDAEYNEKYLTFKNFGQLPCEIRIKIFRYAHHARSIHVKMNQGFVAQVDEEKMATIGPMNRVRTFYKNGPLFRLLTPPNPLHICMTTSRAAMMMADRTVQDAFSDMFSMRFDKLFLRDSIFVFSEQKKFLTREERFSLRHLQVLYYHVQEAKSLDAWAEEIATFAYLDKLEIMISDSRDEREMRRSAGRVFDSIKHSIKCAYNEIGRYPPRVEIEVVGEEEATREGWIHTKWTL